MQTEVSLAIEDSFLTGERALETYSMRRPTTAPVSAEQMTNSRSGSSVHGTIYARAAEFDVRGKEIVYCSNCMLEHPVELSPWNFPICFQAFLHIYEREPLMVGTSNNLYVCPFQFWMSAELVENKQKKSKGKEKQLKIIVHCNHAWDEEKILPPCTVSYGLSLENSGNEPERKTQGTWNCGGEGKQLEWDCLNYGDLINPQKGWINFKNDIAIALEIRRL